MNYRPESAEQRKGGYTVFQLTGIDYLSYISGSSKLNNSILVIPKWLKIKTPNDTSGIAPVFEMFNHATKNNAHFDFDRINKKLYVAANENIQKGIVFITTSSQYI